MKVLITGASGFLGRALVLALARQANLNILALQRNAFFKNDDIKKNVEYLFIEDIADFEGWGEVLLNVDVVIHTAARAHKLKDTSSNPLAEFRRTNTFATVDLVEACISQGVKRFIFISTIGVCGNKNQGASFNEVSVLNPQTDYAMSKYEAEIGLIEKAKQSSMEYVIIRPPLVYACDAPGNIAKLLKLIKYRCPMPLLLVKNARSLIAKENLINFIMLCITHSNAANEIFVISDGDDLSTSQLAKNFAEGMGRFPILLPIPVWFLRFLLRLFGRESMFDQLCSSLIVDISKARTILNWMPKVSAHHATKKTGEDYINRVTEH